MEIKEYIASGVLELYVAGLLSEEENVEVYQLALEHPEIKREILAIEAAILELTKTVAPNYSERKGFEDVQARIGDTGKTETQVVQLPKERKSNLSAYIGWAAALLFGAGLVWFYVQNDQLKSEIQTVKGQYEVLEQQIFEARNSLANTETLLEELRDKNVSVIPLGGQEVSPDAYAKAYWNKEQNKVLIDAQGLPEPPEDMVYQVWSLKMDPLTPTSVGLLEDFAADENKVFTLNNPNESEAFGITLEPAGGSEAPTMEQLYTLGAVSSS
ncbi:anti-sigma factor [Pricia sp. S334]|uniref:Anti-sigma factor n=1 Tax=Pricia mediterranea TaxID=3076079 RepID=A0ABU3L907_9FLAO|nr:anti-sigma factor [Pricia sp. S334]MDT7830234.1 anti-sigma factor [Pricia sp. S334]